MYKELLGLKSEKETSVAKAIRLENKIKGSSEAAYKLIVTILRMLYPDITYDDLKQSIVDDHGDAEIDAIYIDDLKREINIFDVKKCDFDYVDIKLFIISIKEHLFDTKKNISALNPLIQKQLNSARNKLKRNYKVNIYAIRDTRKPAHYNVKKNLLNKLNMSSLRDKEALTTQELFEKYHAINELNAYAHKWDVDLKAGNVGENKIILKKGSVIHTLIGKVSINQLLSLNHTFIKNDKNLFFSNVRNFQNDKNISQKIISAVKNKPNKFYTYHNGITITCTKINDKTNTLFTVTNPQVINGCQTISSLYSCYKDDLTNKNLKQASVLCRFLSLDKPEIESVCEASNTQVKIAVWDLRTNDKVQIILEEGLKILGINYDRKNKSRKYDAVLLTDLAQWIYSAMYGRPAFAKNNKSALFELTNSDPIYYKIFPETLSIVEIATLCKIGLHTKKLIAQIPKRKRTFESHADFHFITGLYFAGKRGANWQSADTFNFIKSKIKAIVKKEEADAEKKKVLPSYNKIFTKTETTWKTLKGNLEKKFKN
jgi:hypothetical protein